MSDDNEFLTGQAGNEHAPGLSRCCHPSRYRKNRKSGNTLPTIAISATQPVR